MNIVSGHFKSVSENAKCVFNCLTVPKVLSETPISIYWQECLSHFDSLAKPSLSTVFVILVHRTRYIKPLIHSFQHDHYFTINMNDWN